MKRTIKFILIPALFVMGLCGCFPSNPAMDLVNDFGPYPTSSVVPGKSSTPGQSSDPGKSSTPGQSSDPGKSSTPSSIDPTATVKVVYLINYNGLVNDPWYTENVVAGTLLTAPKTPTAEDCPDPAYPTFKGWSKRPLVDDLEDLWDFSKDTFEYQTTTFYLYGIWVSE